MTTEQKSHTSGPALPWASPGRGSAATVDNSPQAGDRIEVRWEVEEEDAEPCTKWWGATVLEAGGLPGNIIRIRYDASSGFEAEEVQVELLSQEFLRHADTTEELRWKREGAPCEESDAEDHPPDSVMSLKDLTDEQAEIERLTGRTMEEEAMNQLSQNLQPAQQAEVLSRFMDFAEHFKGQLQQLVQEDQNHVVTADEIQSIAQGFGRR